MSKLPEGVTRIPVPVDAHPGDFVPLITLGINRDGKVGIGLSTKFKSDCESHDEMALEILTMAPQLLTDMIDQLLKTQ